MLVVETLLHHNAGEGFLAYLDFEGRAQFGMSRLDERHAHTLASGDGVVAGGYLTHLSAFRQYRIAMSWNGAAFEFYTDDAAFHPLCLLFEEGIAGDELRFIELAEHAQSGHHGRDVGREFVAIERQSHLES